MSGFCNYYLSKTVSALHRQTYLPRRQMPLLTPNCDPAGRESRGRACMPRPVLPVLPPPGQRSPEQSGFISLLCCLLRPRGGCQDAHSGLGVEAPPNPALTFLSRWNLNGMLAARGLQTSWRQLLMTCGPERQDSLESVTSHFKQPQLTWSWAASHPHARLPPSLSPAL